MTAIRRSAPPRVTTFAQKLLAVLLASVGLVLLLALLVVRRETERQIEDVAERMTLRSRQAFRELEELKRRDLERLGSAFTDSRRTLAAVEAVAAEPALAGPELEWLIQTVRYELELKRMPHSLIAFTDANAAPIVTLRDGAVAAGEDPAGLRAPARRLIATAAEGVDDYRAVEGELFAVRIRRLAIGGSLIGTVALGVPVDDAEAVRLGDVLGVEICFVLDGRCMAGTPFARAHLGDLMAGAQRRGALVRAGDRRWRVVTEQLTPDHPGEAVRVMAVPMDETLAPFARIRRALVIAGTGSVVLALVLGLVLSRQLSGPVRELVGATTRVAAGNYSARVNVRSHDELGQLGEAFNTMTEGLEQKERYRGLLDKVVSPEVAAELLRTEIALGGETREATTLFVDVSSFTPMTEGMDPQRVVALVNRIMSRLGEIVERHGGVVDKYLGDGLMALFGAPVRRPDHASRAVRASLAMQQSMAAMDRELAEGEAPVRVAIGIHTGPVVAGNIGSTKRLSYTAVGESVNLAARLCQGAGPGVILVSPAVREQAGDGFVFAPAGAYPFKGFSRPLEVFEVKGETPPSRPAVASGSLVLLGALLWCLAVPAAAFAQGGLPTLADLGLRYASPGGGFQIDLSGRLDLEGYIPQERPQWLIPATDPFVAGRLRLFADIFAGESVYGLVEVRADRGEAPDDVPLEARIEQVYARVALPGGVQLQAGKFASPVGGYPARHHGPEDPLIRPPIMYDYQTIIDPGAAPGALAGFLGWKDDPARRPEGVPILWNVPYPWGALLAGVAGPFDFRAGVLSAAPSSRPEMWGLDGDRLRRPSLVAAAGVRLIPALRANVYFSRGSYMDELDQGALPQGGELNDFTQRLLGGELVFALGHTAIRAEAYHNRWHVPNIPEDPTDVSYSIEGTLTLSPGLFAAARYGAIRYNELGEGAVATRWDHDIGRFQIGGGYRLVRNVEIRIEQLFSRTSGIDPRDDLFSIQLWWEF